MDDVGDKIIKIIEKCGPLARKDVRQRLIDDYSTELDIRNVQKRLTALVHEEELVLMPRARYQLASRYKEWEAAKFEERRQHTEDLKREVVEPWLRQLSDLRLESTHSYLRLEVEKNDLFDDFERHLSFRLNPYRELRRMKENSERYVKKKANLLEEIAEWIECDFGRIKTQDLHLALFDYGLDLHLHRKWPDEYPSPSKMLGVYTDRRDWVDYYAKGRLVVSLPPKDNQDLSQTVRMTIDRMLSEVDTSRFLKEFDELIEILERMRASRDSMERVLRSHLRLPTFRGICRYLR